MRKRLWVYPNFAFLTLSLRNLTPLHFCIQACTREYADHEGKALYAEMQWS